MIDTHAHIDTVAFDDDREKVIEFAFASGIENIIIPSIEPDTFQNVLEISDKYANIYCGIGIHPHNAKSVNEYNLAKIKKLSSNNKSVVAIGEIGLDYHYDFAPKDVQINAFRSQLKIAKDLDLPVIVHNRESDDDLLKVIHDEQDGSLKGVLHCFSSDEIVLEKALDIGFHVSFTGNITFKKSKLDPVIRKVPNDRFMIETDSPYMAPVPNRGKRNQPSFVRLVAEKISEIKEITFDEVVEMTTNTAKKLFKLPLLLILFGLSFNTVFAQNDGSFDDVFDDDYYEEEEEIKWVNPYKKHIGIGPVLGTNTIVQTFRNDGEDVSYEGIMAFGGAIAYEFFDFFTLQAAYLYSKNTKIAEDWNVAEAENIHQMYEATAIFTANPGNRITFFGGAGPTLAMNQYFQGIGNIVKSNELGINATVGFTFNQKLGNAGFLTASAEWRLNFIFDDTELESDPRSANENSRKPVDVGTFFSIPRLTIMFYPKF